jgi:hypothetical protein
MPIESAILFQIKRRQQKYVKGKLETAHREIIFDERNIIFCIYMYFVIQHVEFT